MNKSKGGMTMTQQFSRRARRAVGADQRHTWWMGVLVAVGATVAAVAVFAVLLGLIDMEDGVIRIVNQVIKVGAICAGVCWSVKRNDGAGIRRGALIGLLYMAVGVLLYAALSSQHLTVMGYLIDLLMGVAAGGLCGMLRAGARRNA